jgi:preprotein translocase subunit SecF
MADNKGEKTSKDNEAGRFNIVAKMTQGFGISAVVIVACVVCLAIIGLNWGIDFKGGSIFHYRFEGEVTEAQVRTCLANSPLKADLGEVVVQRVLGQVDLGIDMADEADRAPEAEGGSEFIIHTEVSEEVTESEDIEPKLEALLGTLGSFKKMRREFIGPTVGRHLQVKALWALVIAILGILCYISLRFEFTHAVAAVVALVHDSVIVLGVFCLLQKEVNIGIMAALLTIIGYSLNDSIVVLDRIRENNRLKARMPFDIRVNLSINQSLSRTVNTSVTTMLAVIALLVLGGVVIRDFALAMTIGVLVGTYSSIFIVSPILVLWHYRSHPNAPRSLTA